MLSGLTLELVNGIPDWVWLAIGGGLFFLIVLAIVLSLRSRRAPTPDEAAGFAWDPGAADAPQPPEPAAAAPGTDVAAFPPPAADPLAPAPAPAAFEAPPAAPPAESGPVHYCRCPACQTQFTVNGPKPIVTNCPGCGKKGYLR